MSKPSWLDLADDYIGLKEIQGKYHNKNILEWWSYIGAWFKDDETPWCGAFVGNFLRRCSRKLPKHPYRALSYMEKGYGTKLEYPAVGAIGVLKRRGGGHVFFVEGETEDGKYIIGLGGNQSNAVSRAKFDKKDILAYVWPPTRKGVNTVPFASRYLLPKFDNNLKSISNMA